MSGANTLESIELPSIPDGWTWSKLSDLGKLDRGRSRHRPRNAKHLYSGPYPFVQTGDIREAVTFIHKYSQTYSEAGLEQSRLWPTGTLCITIAANIAETAILGLDACFPDSVVGFLCDDKLVSVRYIEYYMRTLQQTLERIAPATAQKNLNLATLREVPIAIPVRETQQEIVDKVDELFSKLDAARVGVGASASESSALPSECSKVRRRRPLNPKVAFQKQRRRTRLRTPHPNPPRAPPALGATTTRHLRNQRQGTSQKLAKQIQRTRRPRYRQPP